MKSALRVLTAAPALALALVAAAPAQAVTSQDTITAVSGKPKVLGFSGDGGPAIDAILNEPRDTAVDPTDGSIVMVDTFNNRVRRIGTDGIITTIAGNGSSTYNGDGIAATDASLYTPHDLTVDASGVLYIADSAHHRIRKVENGIITTIAGTGAIGATGDGGLAVNARLKNPKTVALWGGYLYTAGLDNKVRRIDLSTGIITRVAGTGVRGYSGDGGSALDATLNQPQRLVLDSQGNIYIADSGNSVVRRIDQVTGIITTIAGTGVEGNSGDGGLATQALMRRPRGVALDGDDVLYVADSNNHRVRRIDLLTGLITKVAGTVRGYGGDGGPADSAKLYCPRGLTVMPDGTLLIADTLNSMLRQVTPTPVVAP